MASKLMERNRSMLRQLLLMKPLKTRTIKIQRKKRKQTKKKREIKKKRKRALMTRHPRSQPNCN